MTRTRSSWALAFFALTFLVTEPLFIAAAWVSRGQPLDAPAGLGVNALILLGTFGPALVAVALTARSEGRTGLHGLLGRLFRWKVGARSYAFALLYMIAVKLAVAVLVRLSTGAWPRFGSTPFVLLIAATLFSTVVGGQAGEEIGWRGYALPRLAARFGLAGASLVLGVIWALWHLPLFYLRGVDTYGQSFLVYLAQVVAMSVAIAWLYWRTGGSLTLTMLMHAAINNTKDIVPSVGRVPTNPLVPEASLTSWLGLSVLWVIAGTLLVTMRRADLAARPARNDSAAAC